MNDEKIEQCARDFWGDDSASEVDTVCIECNGLGSVLYGDETCPVCLGTGKSVLISSVNGRNVYVTPDWRGESDTCEAFMLICFDAQTKRTGWIEWIRKDREHMWPDVRRNVEPALTALKRAI